VPAVKQWLERSNASTREYTKPEYPAPSISIVYFAVDFSNDLHWNLVPYFDIKSCVAAGSPVTTLLHVVVNNLKKAL